MCEIWEKEGHFTDADCTKWVCGRKGNIRLESGPIPPLLASAHLSDSESLTLLHKPLSHSPIQNDLATHSKFPSSTWLATQPRWHCIPKVQTKFLRLQLFENSCPQKLNPLGTFWARKKKAKCSRKIAKCWDYPHWRNWNFWKVREVQLAEINIFGPLRAGREKYDSLMRFFLIFLPEFRQFWL